jgi:hypothetical protein
MTMGESQTSKNGFKQKSEPERTWGGGGLFLCRKCKGRSRKPLAEVFSLERPVARHFVCSDVKHPRCHSQVAEKAKPQSLVIE